MAYGTLKVDDITSDSGSDLDLQINGITKATLDTDGGFTTYHRNENLVLSWQTVSTVDIDADYLTVYDTSDSAKLLSSVNLTVNITSSGANGLDTGAEADTTWYHIWVIWDGTTTAGLLSTSATAPTMPSGYTFKKYVGATYNVSNDLRRFYQEGNHVLFANNADTWNSQSTSFATVDLSSKIPSTAKGVSGTLKVDFNSAGSYSDVTGTVGAESNGFGNEVHVRFKAPSAGDYSAEAPFSIPVFYTDSIYVKSSNATSRCRGDVSGFYYEDIV